MHDLVPIVMFSGLFLMIFGNRYLQNRENMAMIERGMEPRRRRMRDADPSQTIKFALTFIGAGLGLLAAIFLSKSFGEWLNEGEQTGVYFALIGLFGGLGMLAAYLYERKNPPSDDSQV